MSNWKKYGGTDKLENNNNLSVNSLIADTLTLRTAYKGKLDVQGELNVFGSAIISGDLQAQNGLIKNDLSANRIAVNEVDVSGNLTVRNGNVQINNNLTVNGTVKAKDKLYLGTSNNTYLFSDSSGNIGVNKTNPIATFDISSSQPLAFNVGTSSQETIYSIPLQNSNNRGVVLKANTQSTTISFFNDSSISANNYDSANGTITYSTGGIMTFDVSDNTKILSKLSVSNRNNDASHILQETAVIYDVSSGQYLQNIYNNPSQTTGNALSIVANDSGSNTFMNIITPNKQGLSIGGGVYVNDTSRSMGTIGMKDSSGNYTPSLNIVSGKSNIRNKTTIGINTHAPTTESYIVDLNGPVNLKNGELTLIKQEDFEIRALGVGKQNTRYAVAIGSPYSSSQKHKILYTQDGGENWKENYDLSSESISTQQNNGKLNLNDSYVYDSSFAVICGEYGYIYYIVNELGEVIKITSNEYDIDKYYKFSIFLFDSSLRK
jgi:hypothetical protein